MLFQATGIQYADNVAELVIMIAGIIMAFFTLRKNAKYIGSRLLAAGMVLVGMYGLCIFIYDVSAYFAPPAVTLGLIYVFLRLGMVCILFGVMCLYFAFQVVVHTESWLEKKRTLPLVLAVAVFAIVLYAWQDAVSNISLTPVVNNHIELSMIAILGIGVLLLMLVTLANLYKFGVKQAEGIKRKKMIFAIVGFIVATSSLFINIMSSLTDVTTPAGIAMYQTLVLAFFLDLAAGISIVAYGFITPGQ